MNLLKELNQRPIVYYPIYRQLTGSVTAGVLLSQLMYWFSKKDRIYKTDANITTETLLTVNELRGAKVKIKKLPFIIVTREGIPAKTYYTIDWNIFQTTLVNLTKQCLLNSPNTYNEIHQTINKEAEITTESTTYKAPSRTRSQKTDISFNFETNQFERISPELKAQWSEAFPAVDIDLEIKRIALWVMNNPGKRKKNWGRFLTNWFGRTQERGGNGGLNANKRGNNHNQVNGGVPYGQEGYVSGEAPVELDANGKTPLENYEAAEDRRLGLEPGHYEKAMKHKGKLMREEYERNAKERERVRQSKAQDSESSPKA